MLQYFLYMYILFLILKYYVDISPPGSYSVDRSSWFLAVSLIYHTDMYAWFDIPTAICRADDYHTSSILHIIVSPVAAALEFIFGR